jgi:hypothetical protein
MEAPVAKRKRKVTPWSKRIRALQKKGFSLRDIAHAIGRSRGAVGDLAVGRNAAPVGDVAIALDALHREHCVNGNAQDTAAALEALRLKHRGKSKKKDRVSEPRDRVSA